VGADAQVIDLEYSHIIPCGTSLAG
jgi:hypothetical protein